MSKAQRKIDPQAPLEEPSTAVAIAKPALVPAVLDDQDYRQAYLDQVAPVVMAGRLIKFSGKDGKYTYQDDGKEVDLETEFVALMPELMVGWIKFPREGGTPDRRMGFYYQEGFRIADRNSLGDLDESAWDDGLDGKPTDPWLHQIAVVLQGKADEELYCFASTTPTGRSACGQLMRYYDRLQMTAPGAMPIVKLGVGGYNHRDTQIGWVVTPKFKVIGRTEIVSAPIAVKSIAAEIDDEIPAFA